MTVKTSNATSKPPTPLAPSSSSPHTPVGTPNPTPPAGHQVSPAPSTPTSQHDQSRMSDRDRQKLREQERRRREAVSKKVVDGLSIINFFYKWRMNNVYQFTFHND